MKKIRRGKYRHFKGKFYKVIGVALQTVTNEKMVLYRALYGCPDLREEYGEQPIFTRPVDNFLEKKMIDGKEVERFKFCEDY